MVKSRSSVVLSLILALGACAPSQTLTNPSAGPSQPSPDAERPVVEETSPEPVAEEITATPEEALAIAPDNWWLLDPVADRVFGTSAERAYQELLPNRSPQRTVVVAIVDSGVDVEHEDLDDNIWVNEDELPGNGVDDDGNGYVDDVHGWSFLGGPGGEDVHYDTYEVTRLYVQCQETGQVEGAACEEIEAELEAERNEAESMLQQYEAMNTTLESVTAFLKQFLDTDTLTREQVAGIRSLQGDVMQARQIYLQFADVGATPEALAEGIEALTARVEYGLNPEFDPRPAVGDDYSDPTERYYGSSRVEGPAAEHGTHVAGIIGAERGNGLGVDGIAPAVELMVLRAVPQGDERDKDVANAIRYAVDNGAHIINMSFGKGFSPGKELVDDAVRYAESRGVLLVHAAGNDGADLDADVNYPNRYYEEGDTARLWIEVGASNWQRADQLAAPFSNYSQTRVDVFAPGVEILSTTPGGDYERNQGTSMAAPVVSGLAAMLMAYYPDLTTAQVKEIILETAQRFPGQEVAGPGNSGPVAFRDLSVTGGIVNAYAAMERAAELSAQAAR